METDQTSTFTALRPWLHSLAYQLLGSRADADDMVQECFLRWQQTEFESIRCPKAFLTTVMTRLCLKHLQSARMRRERSFGAEIPEFVGQEQVVDPSDYAHLADSLSIAMFVMLKSLAPVERAVFLLREVFDCDYEEIGSVLGKTPENCRQILSRARERVAGRQPRFLVDPQHQEQALQSFLRACASGNWRDVLTTLADDVTLVRDGADLSSEAGELRGADSVATCIEQNAARWFPNGALLQTIHFHEHPVVISYCEEQPVSAIVVTITEDRVTQLWIITCPVRLRALALQHRFLDASRVASFGDDGGGEPE